MLLSACAGGAHRVAIAPPPTAPAAPTTVMAAPSPALVAAVDAAAERIAAVSSVVPTAAWDRLAELADGYGSRITGVKPENLRRNAAAIALLGYVLAEG